MRSNTISCSLRSSISRWKPRSVETFSSPGRSMELRDMRKQAPRGYWPASMRRDQAYIGVLIDDLVTKGTSEPYRMFTSRAEYRLLLRQDNADSRLSEIGYQIGLLPPRNYQRFRVKQAAVVAEIERLQTTRSGTNLLAHILRRPDVRYADLPMRDDSLSPEVANQVEIEIKYQGYIERQETEVKRFRSLEDKRIPEWFRYNEIPSLRTEARLKLDKIRPATIGHASRISGVSPADISILMV